MLSTSSAYSPARPVASIPDSQDYDDLMEFNASFPSVDTLQIMKDAGIEEAEFTVKVNGIQVGGTMSTAYLNQDLSKEAWDGAAEFMLRIDGEPFTTYSS